MKILYTTLVLLFAFGGAANAFAQKKGCAGNLPSGICLPGAPVFHSPEDISDYQAVLKLQETRTADECKRAVSEQRLSIKGFFGAPYGPLTSAEVNAVETSVYSKGAFASGFIGLAKHEWARPRPYDSHSDLTPCVGYERSFSYPSGHAAIAQFYANFLIELYPAKKAALQTRAEQIAFDRSLGGVHYPSDIRDGKLLGNQVYLLYRQKFPAR